MLLELDDLPVHQAPVPLAHAMGGHPDAYDRFFFNAFTEDRYVAVALGIYPGRGVADAAVGVVHDGVQRSVFASGRLDGRATSVGPISIELVEPMRVATVRVDAPEHGLVGELTYTAWTGAIEEARQTRHDGARLLMDFTRATQLGTWRGALDVGGTTLSFDGARGTKDRSWGIRPVGPPTPVAPSTAAPQLFFVWAPLHFEDVGFHLSRFEDQSGAPWATVAASLSPLAAGQRPVDPAAVHVMRDAVPRVAFERGLRRAARAAIEVTDDDVRSVIELEPVLTFRMRGAGYFHPTYAHGHFHGELVVAGEVHDVGELDTTSFHDVHVEQVVRATWGERRGLGVLELLAVGPHGPSGLTGLLEGAR